MFTPRSRLLPALLLALLALPSLPLRAGQDEGWMIDLRNKLKLTVSCDFAEITFEDAVSFLQNLTSAAIVIDPRALTPPPEEITLKLQNRPIEELLNGILKQAGMEYELRDEAVFIFRAGAGARKSGTRLQPLTTTEEQAVKSALEKLSSSQFAERDEAQRFLHETGPSAATLVNATANATTDAEALIRLQRLLESYNSGVAYDESDLVKRALNGLNQRVTFELAETPFQNALEFLRGMPQLRAMLGPTQLPGDRKISLRVTRMQAGNVLRWLARLADARLVLAADGRLQFEEANAVPSNEKPANAIAPLEPARQ